jgi:hypothetical protein
MGLEMQPRRWRVLHIGFVLLHHVLRNPVLGFDAEEAKFTAGMQPLDDRGMTVRE